MGKANGSDDDFDAGEPNDSEDGEVPAERSEDEPQFEDDDENLPPSKRRKKKPGQFTRIEKLKKLAKAVGLGNPKLWKTIKPLSEKKAIQHIEELMETNEIDYSDLSQPMLQKIEKEHRLKREVEELGNNVVVSGSRRRKKINYATFDADEDAEEEVEVKEDSESDFAPGEEDSE